MADDTSSYVLGRIVTNRVQRRVITHQVIVQAPTLDTAGVAPSVLTQPSASSPITEGDTVSATPGTYAGTPAPTRTRRYWELETSPGVWGELAGTDSLTYTSVSGQGGKRLRVNELYENASGAVIGTSAPVVVEAVAVTLTSPPTHAAVLAIGVPVTATSGGTTGAVDSTSWQWRRLGAPISGATSQTYTPVEADIGPGVLSVTQTVTGAGSSDAASSTSARVVDTPAAITARLGVTGHAWDYSDASKRFRDAAGTLPASVAGQVIRRLDASIGSVSLLAASDSQSEVVELTAGVEVGTADGINDTCAAAISLTGDTSVWCVQMGTGVQEILWDGDTTGSSRHYMIANFSAPGVFRLFAGAVLASPAGVTSQWMTIGSTISVAGEDMISQNGTTLLTGSAGGASLSVGIRFNDDAGTYNKFYGGKSAYRFVLGAALTATHYARLDDWARHYKFPALFA